MTKRKNSKSDLEDIKNIEKLMEKRWIE